MTVANQCFQMAKDVAEVKPNSQSSQRKQPA